MAAKEYGSTFAAYIFREVPELYPVYAAHMRDYEGQLFAHMVMGDLRRAAWCLHGCAESLQQSLSESAETILRRLLSCIENGLASGDTEATELITTGFLETIDQQDPFYEGFVGRLGPLTRKQLRVVEQSSYTPDDGSDKKRDRNGDRNGDASSS